MDGLSVGFIVLMKRPKSALLVSHLAAGNPVWVLVVIRNEKRIFGNRPFWQ
jgi:hypothetical protein